MTEVASVAAFCLAAAVGRWFFDSKRPAPVPAAIVAAFGEITHLAVDAFSNTAEMSEIYRGLCRPYLKARDGAIEFLKGATAAGIPCALVTGGPMTNVDFVVDGLKIREHFAYIVDVSQYERGKPAPDCYLLAAAKLGVEPRDCVVFEDAINGIRSARAAGMSVVAITGTHDRRGLEDAGPDRIVSSFRELP